MATLFAQEVEEPRQGRLVAPDPGPHQAPAVVVHADRQVAVPLFVADLVDADPHQALEGVMGRSPLGHHSFDDGSNGAPGNAQELYNGGLGGVGDEPGRLVVEVPGMARPMAGPGHLGHGDAVGGARDPGRVGLEVTQKDAQIEGPPLASASALVIERGPHPTTPAAALARASWPDVDDHGF